MSGYPTHENVASLRGALQELRESDAEVAELTRRYEQCKKALPLAQDKAEKAMRNVLDILRQMDCASTGNHGWENRFATLMLRLTEDRK